MLARIGSPEKSLWQAFRQEPGRLVMRCENRLAAGWPDAVCLLQDGRVIFIELKALDGERKDYGLSAAQRLWASRYIRSGGKVLLCCRVKNQFRVVVPVSPYPVLISGEESTHVFGTATLSRLG